MTVPIATSASATPHPPERVGHPPADRARSLRISVVIPARDEEHNIAWVLGRIPDHVDEVILVDGLSRDATIAVAQIVMPSVQIVHQLDPGKGNALRAGFESATGDVIVMLDADGSMDPAEIPNFIDPLAGDSYDIAKGSRFLPGAGTADMTALRRIGNAGLLRLANALYRTRHSDLCYGYVAFRREALASLRADARGFEIEMQLVARMASAGLRVIEVPSYEHARRHGASSLRTFRDGWRVLLTMLFELQWRPIGQEHSVKQPLRTR